MNNENNNQNQKEYYVYIHVDKLTGLVLYTGKGTRREYVIKSGKHKGKKGIYDRAYSNDDRPYKIDETIEVIKVKYFDNDREALNYEEFLTNWYRACGQCWFNEDMGNKHGEECKRKLSEAHKGKHTGENNCNYGKTGAKHPSFKGYVYCPELDMYFEGTVDAEKRCRDMGIKIYSNHISNCINGKKKTHGHIIKNGEKTKLTWIRKELITNV
ncbi:MAG: NUMOD3 domain-containing DNA-binding protein [Clostridium baratii]|nr:NUMOD3 domain-containing DNA-binding protein [Clostridium baratii]